MKNFKKIVLLLILGLILNLIGILNINKEYKNNESNLDKTYFYTSKLQTAEDCFKTLVSEIYGFYGLKEPLFYKKRYGFTDYFNFLNKKPIKYTLKHRMYKKDITKELENGRFVISIIKAYKFYGYEKEKFMPILHNVLILDEIDNRYEIYDPNFGIIMVDKEDIVNNTNKIYNFHIILH